MPRKTSPKITHFWKHAQSVKIVKERIQSLGNTDAYLTRIQRNYSKFTANFVKMFLLLLLWLLFHCKVKTSHAQHMTTRSKNERSAGRHSSKSRFLLDTKCANHWVKKKPTTSQFFFKRPIQ